MKAAVPSASACAVRNCSSRPVGWLGLTSVMMPASFAAKTIRSASTASTCVASRARPAQRSVRRHWRVNGTKRVAEIMDRDEDVLFLFITSHGTRDHQASSDFYPMRLKPVDPRRLKELLDQSGIRRRVVVVSTCYSGAFVDALKDDSTLVIAASAGDKSSFGCSNEAALTYFGKAYFDEALRRTDSSSDAFQMARTTLPARKRKATFSTSDPLMALGKGDDRAP